MCSRSSTFQRAVSLLFATLLLALFGVVGGGGTAYAIGTNDYPWAAATAVPNVQYGWGYQPTCPANDTNCMALNYTETDGTKWGYSDPWSYALRNCTSFVAWRLAQQGFDASGMGMAANWGLSAKGSGHVNNTPVPGAVAWWAANKLDQGYSVKDFGHVAYVDSVNTDGSVNIEEYNYGGTGAWHVRTIIPGTATEQVQFIHLADLTGTSSTPPPTNNFRAVFQSNTSQGYLYTYDSAAGTGVTDQGIMAGTSPSIAYVPGHGWEAAFHAQNGDLFLWGDDGRADTLQGMMAGTSPAIAASSGGGFQVAFQANNGYMYLYNSTSGALNTGLGMMAGTSPAIAYVGGKGYEEAFQANTGNLFVWGDVVSEDTQQGMMHTTSPAITGTTGGGYRVAFQANVGYMYLFDSVLGSIGTGQGMMANTSPSITALASGGYEEAFQANTGNLFVWDQKSYDTGQGMMGGTSPSIASSSTSNFRVAFQANNTYLYTYDAASGSLNTLQGIAAGTSPGMTGY